MIDSTETGITLVTGTLEVTDVSINDNGTRYRCQPNNSNLISNVATLTVLGMCMYMYIAYVCILYNIGKF